MEESMSGNHILFMFAKSIIGLYNVSVNHPSEQIIVHTIH